MIEYFLATLIGLTLGLLGGGGSILTVPILVFVVKLDPKMAIGLSLAIVGLTSLFGVYGHYKSGNMDFKTASLFAPLAMVGAYFGAKIAQLITGQTQILLFAVIMILASISMFKGNTYKVIENKDTTTTKNRKKILFITLAGLIVGIITGVVGVGGGFLIVPALVLLADVSMKKAVGTSLLIISLNSFTGFYGYVGVLEVPWLFLAKFTSFSILGIFIGTYLVKYVSQKVLKKSFAVFLILMGVFIIYKNRGTLITINSISNQTSQELT